MISVRAAWRSYICLAVALSCFDLLKVVPYLKAYSTRHTFATCAIAFGVSPEKVAYWIGDNVQTVLRYYCHPDVTKSECPDF
ncbi:hypothetical protein [Nostoc sp. LEGE 12447]|uniref:hypothetical protein n=1 Tax=Nostoc sp. LEGE 12447 TaxID=1828640 RepID=UPI001D146E5F|nr:hypothetical protein [Nostoc sp. LEGE 12447]